MDYVLQMWQRSVIDIAVLTARLNYFRKKIKVHPHRPFRTAKKNLIHGLPKQNSNALARSQRDLPTDEF